MNTQVSAPVLRHHFIIGPLLLLTVRSCQEISCWSPSLGLERFMLVHFAESVVFADFALIVFLGLSGFVDSLVFRPFCWCVHITAFGSSSQANNISQVIIGWLDRKWATLHRNMERVDTISFVLDDPSLKSHHYTSCLASSISILVAFWKPIARFPRFCDTRIKTYLAIEEGLEQCIFNFQLGRAPSHNRTLTT